MLFRNPTEKAFFIEMLANGIPIKEDTPLEEIYEELTKAATELQFFDVVLDDNIFIFYDDLGEIRTIVKREFLEENTKLIFQVDDYEKAMSDAQFIGKIVFILTSICAELRCMLFKKPRAVNGQEDKYEFDSEFI